LDTRYGSVRSREPNPSFRQHDISICIRQHLRERQDLKADGHSVLSRWHSKLSHEYIVLSFRRYFHWGLCCHIHVDYGSDADQTTQVLIVIADAGRVSCRTIFLVQRASRILSRATCCGLRLAHHRLLNRSPSRHRLESTVEKEFSDLNRSGARALFTVIHWHDVLASIT
jgi:hypothetical protein